jgi:hypothetical protein
MGLMPVARYAYVGLVWLFLVGVVIQVFLAGLGLFSSDPRDIALHVNLGWVLHLWPILILIAAAFGRVGRPTLLWVGALVATVLVQPFLPGLAPTSALLAALHLVNALLIFWIAVKLALGGPALLPGRATS